jgi:hypothetical protein
MEWNILLFRSGGFSGNYPMNAEGIVAALSAAGGDGIVYMGEGTLETDFLIPAGVHLLGMGTNSRIEGFVTCEGSSIMNLAIHRASHASGDEEALRIQGANECEIRDCMITALQSGAGDAYAIRCKSSRPVKIFNSHIEAEHDYSGDAYGIFLDECDDIYMYGGYLGGTTAPYLGS